MKRQVFVLYYKPVMVKMAQLIDLKKSGIHQLSRFFLSVLYGLSAVDASFVRLLAQK